MYIDIFRTAEGSTEREQVERRPVGSDPAVHEHYAPGSARPLTAAAPPTSAAANLPEP